MEDEELDREIRVLEESIARLTRRLDDLKRRRMAGRAKNSTSGTLPSMRAVRDSDEQPPTSKRRR